MSPEDDSIVTTTGPESLVSVTCTPIVPFSEKSADVNSTVLSIVDTVNS